MKLPLTAALGVVALTLCSCATPTIDGAKPRAGALVTTLTSAAAANQQEATAARARARREAIDEALGAGDMGLVSGAFDETICAGYDRVGTLRADAIEYAGAAYGINALSADSPATLVGLANALDDGLTFPAPANLADLRKTVAANIDLKKTCLEAAADATLGYTTLRAPNAGQPEGGVGLIVGVVDVFRTLILPVAKQGLTRADRERRLKALRAWAFLGVDNTADARPTGDATAGLPHLLKRLEVNGWQADYAARLARRQALGRAQRAWAEVAAAYKATTPCQSTSVPNHELARPGAPTTREAYLDACIEARRNDVKAPLEKFLQTATAYDAAFDLNPAQAYDATRLAGLELQNWFSGGMSDDDASYADAAMFSAMYEWLKFFAAVEAVGDDANRKKLESALAAFAKMF